MNKLISLIAGPTDKSKLYRFGNIHKSEYNSYLENIAQTIYPHVRQVNIIPDNGVTLDLAIKFRSLGGNVFGFVPEGGSKVLDSYLQYCSETHELKYGWTNLNTALSLEGDIITAIGLSPGTIVEIAYTKYHNKYYKKNIPILMDLRTISSRINDEIAEEINIHYFQSENELDILLKTAREGKL